MKGLRDSKGTRNTCIFRRENRLSFSGTSALYVPDNMVSHPRKTYFQGHRSKMLDPSHPHSSSVAVFVSLPGSCFIHSFISIQPLGRFSRNQNPVRRPVWLWHAASWASAYPQFYLHSQSERSRYMHTESIRLHEL